ncbi:MAG: UvrD-helicase domain-containing protein [Terracidiphilus sp.]|jgi:ATP-dependent exoDNAse (exonuclease V) beta subunit
MLEAPLRTPPPDQAARDQALDPRRSILVRAPAGSGKTTLLAERFLSLLAEVDDPGEVVAITFTEAAAAEMRNRVLDELRKDDLTPLARRALDHSQKLGWNLLDLPAQLRISTIDSFCRDLALQQPLLSGLGGGLDIAAQPADLYRRAARRTLEQLGSRNAAFSAAIESLLLWRDNNWQEIESQLVDMLRDRDRWMHGFVLDRDPDWPALRERLERPLARANPADPALAHYTDEEWAIVRACFTLLRHAAAELRVVFAESAAADFTEVAQIALRTLKGEDGLPTDAALAVADGIRHLLVDEFQDTSRRQHQLLAHLVAAWPERDGRTCFVVGDPMQSIYFFRDADAELFPRVEQLGLEIPGDLSLCFDPVQLTANFRTAPPLVGGLNEMFSRVFALDDGSGVTFAKADPARDGAAQPGPHLVADSAPPMQLHLEFMPETPRGNSRNSDPERKKAIAAEREAAGEKQVEEIIAIVRGHLPRIDEARAANEKKQPNEKREKYRVSVLGRARKSLTPIAAALREASIPFRAVELEELQSRPEIIDALALARALLNPHDRVSWLGVLRAPWCGLSLADLHTLVSADAPGLLARPIPELLSERSHLLSPEGRHAVDRLLCALEFSLRLRSTQPADPPGTWLEQVWLSLGGAQCVDASARANLDLLWSTLDALPQGESDLLGPALAAALQDLKAQPDPNAGSDCGVQLMTIHGAKGLEFEVVIVPDLQAGAGRGGANMLSWLERGLPPQPDSDGSSEPSELTEFLVAPFQSKGAERGKAKEWVDRVRRDREKQETRRLLYVAATRARDELHFFARPSYKSADGVPTELVEPRDSLLATAWPAWKAEIERRFRDFIARAAASAEPSILESIAASAAGMTTAIPPSESPARLRRLPPDFRAASAELSSAVLDEPLLGAGRLYERHEGGLISRALGKAVHALLQQYAQLLATQPDESARVALAQMQPRIAASIRSAGVESSHAGRIAAQALRIVLTAAADPLARWILAPHADAANEDRWTGVVGGSLRAVQVDRVFRAGPAPQTASGSAGRDTWWIVDYKTAHEDGLDPASALPELRALFKPQIEVYAAVLRNLRGQDIALRGGLYYPRMALFDWWQL